MSETIENPKGSRRPTESSPHQPVPATSLAWLAEAHLDGAIKYGALNWRNQPIKLSDYIDAAIRHLLALKEGEDVAGDSQIPHAAHVMAGMSIVLDAAACGTLVDDRVNARPDALAEVQSAILERRAQVEVRKAA
ncbi:dATP/dGTP diphosphohydrolase domain-containing protein [Jiella sp. M17.18]|uniref:dATP/dGTP diphosphohydrolase domain-containing protein n=1 Tax=Jiella sp. M17.18 TaxID=3234247 RepID=UPI0034DE3A1A